MTSRPALSLSLYLRDRAVLLVGTGPGADERLDRLRDGDANVKRMTEERWQEGARPTEKYFLVVAHSSVDALNAEVATWAQEHATLSYAHDQPAFSDFAFPALAKRGALRIAISTQGVAPALAARLRRELDAKLAASGSGIDTIVAELERVRREFPRGQDRMKILSALAAKVRLVGEFEIKL
ncbi:MAG: hypothetical protein GY811_03650 [Myxococcales bacterium]|nr:hypothetical protein [Myxococcales bacterium]